MAYKDGKDQNWMIEIAETKLKELREDYVKAHESGDKVAEEEIVAEGKKWRLALDIMKQVMERKNREDEVQLGKDAEEVFGA